jgi:hypothetical protein
LHLPVRLRAQEMTYRLPADLQKPVLRQAKRAPEPPALPVRHRRERREIAEQGLQSVPDPRSGCWWPLRLLNCLARKSKEQQLEPAVKQLTLPARTVLP